MLPVSLSLFLYFLACDIVFCWDDLTMDVLVNFAPKRSFPFELLTITLCAFLTLATGSSLGQLLANQCH
jgi:ABC-type methionine transport system permease subunit